MRALAVALALAATGCLSEGKLGEAVFEYQCVDDSDVHCSFGSFPEALAVGARFRATARRSGGGGPLVVSPAAAAKLGAQDGDLVVRDDGIMSILALEGSTVVDIFDLQAAPIAELSVRASATGPVTSEPTLSLAVTDLPREVAVRPLSDLGGELGGALTYSWEVSPAGILDLSPVPGDNVATVTPLAPGQATITVRQGTTSVEGTLEVIVEDDA